MQWRKYFGMSWQEYLDTPPHVFFTDLEMIGVENEAEAAHQAKNHVPK